VIKKAGPNGPPGLASYFRQNALPAQRFDTAHSGAVNEAPSELHYKSKPMKLSILAAKRHYS